MPRIATIGFFDGVHRGHGDLFRQLCATAIAERLEPMLCTFREHPQQVLTKICPPLLTTVEERLDMLSRYAEVECLDFETFHGNTAGQFVRYLHDRFGVEMLLMGYDHRFGSDGLTTLQDYVAAAQPVGVRIAVAQPYQPEGEHISSSVIRQLLQDGNIEHANRLLGYAYTLSGKVEHGNGIGKTIGFPTANIGVPAEKLLPPCGVYAGRANDLPAVINIGTNPTVGNDKVTVEVHIPHIHDNLYGKEVNVRLERYVRAEKHFPNLNELREQIGRDIVQIMEKR